MTRDDLEHGGAPIRLSRLEHLSGLSRYKLMNDAARGDLEIVKIRCGQLWYRHVQPSEALRYLEAIGFEWPQAS